jgi:hypothetical protein
MQGYARTLRWCCENEAKFQVRGIDGGTPIYWAGRFHLYLSFNALNGEKASCREVESIRALIDAGASPNLANSKGETPLDVACLKMIHPPTATVLLEMGAQVSEELFLKAVRNHVSVFFYWFVRHENHGSLPKGMSTQLSRY